MGVRCLLVSKDLLHRRPLQQRFVPFGKVGVLRVDAGKAFRISLALKFDQHTSNALDLVLEDATENGDIPAVESMSDSQQFSRVEALLDESQVGNGDLVADKVLFAFKGPV